LLGAVLGGVLVSPLLLTWTGGLLPPGGAGPLSLSLLLLLVCYGLAGLLNIGVPDSGACYPACSRHPAVLTRDFWQAHRRLWRDREGGLSLAVTTLFWGVGATLQFAVLRWAGESLALPLSQAAYLQAVVAVGVVAGASAAARWVPLVRARRMLIMGVLLGLLMPLIALTGSVAAALPLLVAVGAVGGLLVVPLNALLQHRGHLLLTAGRSIAVQGFNENASVLAMLALYAACTAMEWPIVPLMSGFGVAIAVVMGLLMWRDARPGR
jgi:hypothetical protein